MGVFRVAIVTGSAKQLVPALIATALILPPQVWLILTALRGRSGALHRRVLGGIAVVIVAALPFVGVTWLGALFPLSALVLVFVRRPQSVLIFGALVLAPIPIAFGLNAPAWASYFSVGTVMYGASVAVPIWLIAAARELQEARLLLADDAVVRERIRIDRELGPTVDAALARIADRGELAHERARHDPGAAAIEVRSLVDSARQTMADVRRLIRGYQVVPLRAELRTTMRLLAAAGIETQLVVPPGELPATLRDDQRRQLRSSIATLLSTDAVDRCVCVVTNDNGLARVELSAEMQDRPATDAALA
jgi:two-component system sensor histidine kinase DesK